MGTDRSGWCKYHRVRGHDNDSCIHLRQEIEKLIQNGKLRGYAKESKGEDKRKSKRDQKPKKEGPDEEQRDKHTLHTISGGLRWRRGIKHFSQKIRTSSDTLSRRQQASP